ncbi:ABC transporter permease [Clostridium thermosuccinogenes]|jgi:multiple sugar transport system permease protein|uniref:ABC transporter permease n=1 Tax=Clostridium thermosuccinogenes TaxID=84032 RepID=A0A2K2FAH5_9CLOT|nr:sugar ABC transporter permease [Pseudoclostridium thermosuccinogenes]AUS95805.1 ABC transporter permease [Pseudoclostridium thermosuccinogenes]PNT93476.1 ABC transporter permease [Pseudoclostridium thermosuccinogenes]PNT95757.1 ABC transporter permease [Pseudoclostridium thermosuccinogenes]PNT97041.1 ABC transporter permease [Pseudoclostridium thermosuccinogenes]
MGDKIRANGKYNFRRNKNLYLMMLPFLILFFTFNILPVLSSVVLSFTNFNVLQKPDFVGLDNYRKLFLVDSIFTTAIKNTFVIAVITGPIGYLLSFLMAWLINELPTKIRAILTIVFYAPSISGNVYLIFALIFSGDPYGYLNANLLNWGFIDKAILWLQDTRYMIPIVVLVSLWMSLGFGFLSFIAGLQTIDKAQYEAAAIDGIKNRWQELWYVTLPNMKPQLMFGAVMSITTALGVGDITVALTGFPSTSYAAHTIVNHLNDYGSIRMEMGYASSIAVVLFAIMVISNQLVQKFLKRVGT